MEHRLSISHPLCVSARVFYVIRVRVRTSDHHALSSDPFLTVRHLILLSFVMTFVAFYLLINCVPIVCASLGIVLEPLYLVSHCSTI